MKAFGSQIAGERLGEYPLCCFGRCKGSIGGYAA